MPWFYRREDGSKSDVGLHDFACGGALIRNDGTGSATVAPVHTLHWDYHTRGDILSSVIDKIVVCWMA